MRVALALFLVAFAGFLAGAERPNVVVIVADDIGWADVGFHGSDVISPELDKLAKEGVELKQFYVYPTCSPTRAAFMTGRPPSRFGITGPLQIEGDRGLPKDAGTIAQAFLDGGYDTAISGKWHLGMKPELGPSHYGFRHSYGYVGPWLDSYTHLTTDFMGTQDGIRQWHRNGKLFDEEGHVTDLVTAEAIRFITSERDKSKPFFLYLPYSAPHAPCQEPGRWLEMYEGKIENASRKYFAASITHMDDGIRQVRETLQREGVAANTIIVFFSDNGGQRGGDHTRWLRPPRQFYMTYGATDVLGNNLPLRGWKGQLYEGGIHVPALAYWPGRLQSGEFETPMVVCDLWPTLAAAAGGVAVGKEVEGANLWGVLDGGETAPERTIYWGLGSRQAVRQGNWKLIRNGRDGEYNFELFDLRADPNEKQDLAGARPEVVDRLERELEGQRARDVR